ncbi:MAG: TRAP transporter small permease [Gammaproteobacteria bacterium]|nr:TRAP transporter small permease [Gammaproteobacteria bacterium]
MFLNNTNKIINVLHILEDVIVSLILITMILFSLYQIFMRNFMDSGFIWGDHFLRILVLWLGLVGAILASRKGKQISIDVLSQFIPSPYKSYIKKFNLLFSAVICLLISYYSYQFVYLEYKDATIAFESIPAWLTQAIIPVGFFIMSLKYIAQILNKKIE